MKIDWDLIIYGARPDPTVRRIRLIHRGEDAKRVHRATHKRWMEVEWQTLRILDVFMGRATSIEDMLTEHLGGMLRNGKA